MFLLIEYLEAQGDPQKNFNTSHVSINLFRAGCPCTTNFNFNTSHVSINQFQAWTDGMFGHISIHLMFLLILNGDPIAICFSKISIHLMFLLIIFQRIPFRIYSVISIHLMFLLILFTVTQTLFICYFNTSHVSINRKAESCWRKVP